MGVANNQLLRRLGLLLVDDFIGPHECEALMEEIDRTEGEAATIGGTARTVDPVYRRTKEFRMSGPAGLRVKASVDGFAPDLEQHFGVSFSGRQGIRVLRYGEGDYFRPHRDATDAPGTRQRAVSVSLLLNQPDDPGGRTYAGGSLEFAELFPVRDGQDAVIIPVDPHPGMLVAFPADVLHQVTPITGGLRYSVVTWFLAPTA